MLGSLIVLFVVLLIKISVSDTIRGVKKIKGNIAENKRIQQKMEHAKMIR